MRKSLNRNKNKSWNQNSKKNNLTTKKTRSQLVFPIRMYCIVIDRRMNEYANLFRICHLHRSSYRGSAPHVLWDSHSSKGPGRCSNRDPCIRICRGSRFWLELQSVRSINKSNTIMTPFLFDCRSLKESNCCKC